MPADRIDRALLNEEGSKLTVIQVHPDSASMEFHLQINSKHFATSFEFLDASFKEQFYGTVSDALGTELAKWDDPQVEVTKMPVHEAGFTRSNVRWLRGSGGTCHVGDRRDVVGADPAAAADQLRPGVDPAADLAGVEGARPDPRV